MYGPPPVQIFQNNWTPSEIWQVHFLGGGSKFFVTLGWTLTGIRNLPLVLQCCRLTKEEGGVELAMATPRPVGKFLSYAPFFELSLCAMFKVANCAACTSRWSWESSYKSREASTSRRPLWMRARTSKWCAAVRYSLRTSHQPVRQAVSGYICDRGCERAQRGISHTQWLTSRLLFNNGPPFRASDKSIVLKRSSNLPNLCSVSGFVCVATPSLCVNW